MEKKTIGAFIAVLRKAAGMTQRELAERLNVSDKSVSRWERDECAPDLTLIPVMAEMFGVTSDELLRGERRAADAPEEASKFIREKGSREYRNLLRTRLRRMQNLCLIPICLMLVGFFGALLIASFPISGDIAFWAAMIFYAVAAVLFFAFLRSARIDRGDAPDDSAWCAHQNEITRKGTWYFIWLWILFVMTPWALTGLGQTETWQTLAVCGAFAALSAFLIIRLILRPILLRRELFIVPEEEKPIEKKKHRLLLVISVPVISVMWFVTWIAEQFFNTLIHPFLLLAMAAGLVVGLYHLLARRYR